MNIVDPLYKRDMEPDPHAEADAFLSLLKRLMAEILLSPEFRQRFLIFLEPGVLNGATRSITNGGTPYTVADVYLAGQETLTPKQDTKAIPLIGGLTLASGAKVWVFKPNFDDGARLILAQRQ